MPCELSWHIGRQPNFIIVWNYKRFSLSVEHPINTKCLGRIPYTNSSMGLKLLGSFHNGATWCHHNHRNSNPTLCRLLCKSMLHRSALRMTYIVDMPLSTIINLHRCTSTISCNNLLIAFLHKPQTWVIASSFPVIENYDTTILTPSCCKDCIPHVGLHNQPPNCPLQLIFLIGRCPPLPRSTTYNRPCQTHICMVKTPLTTPAHALQVTFTAIWEACSYPGDYS